MQSLSDLAKQLNTGLLWENCHGTVAPGAKTATFCAIYI
jgi:hypothetical protein